MRNDAESLKRQLHAALLVRETLTTDGWADIIQPIIDRSIGDILGHKRGKKWAGGLISKTEHLNKIDYYIGYKQALVDLNNRIWNYLLSISALEEQIKRMGNRETKMAKEIYADSKYSSKE